MNKEEQTFDAHNNTISNVVNEYNELVIKFSKLQDENSDKANCISAQSQIIVKHEAEIERLKKNKEDLTTLVRLFTRR